MSQESGVWQQPWPRRRLPEPILALMRTHEWGDRLRCWPTNETLTGHSKRDLSRIRELLRVLEDSTREDGEDNLLFAPEKWEASPEFTRTAFYKDQLMVVTEEQHRILRNWTPAKAVPHFDLFRAAGKAGQWNYLQPHIQKGGKQKVFPPIMSATPDYDMFDEFLRVRTDDRDEPLLDLFHPKVIHKGGWMEYQFKQYKEEALPTHSNGEQAWHGKPEFVRRFHGLKTEAIYGVLSSIKRQHGGLRASGNKDGGERYNEDKKGVYFHAEGERHNCHDYSHRTPLFGDGSYIYAHLECVCVILATVRRTSTRARRSSKPTRTALRFCLRNIEEGPASTTRRCG